MKPAQNNFLRRAVAAALKKAQNPTTLPLKNKNRSRSYEEYDFQQHPFRLRRDDTV